MHARRRHALIGRPTYLHAAVTAALVCAGCTGLIGGDDGSIAGGSGAGANNPQTSGPEASYASIEARRLSKHELAQAVRDVFGAEVVDLLDALAEDDQTPFDNDYTRQSPSASLIEGVHLVSRRLGERLLEDRSVLEALTPCVPNGAADEACLRAFIERVGRRALRRPLSATEVDEYVALSAYSIADSDFLVAPSLVVSALVQDLEFLYRVEIGEAVADQPDLRRLTGYEVATRLSFLLWGTTPDDTLLDAAERGELDDADGVSTWATKMLDDARARPQIARFHALWLDYDRLPHDPLLATAMLDETDALVKRVVFEDNGDWTGLFLAEDTFVGPVLADHYGLPSTSTASWVSYPDLSQRRGILSHASFLSVGGKFGDTSPVLRGKNVLERLLCREIPTPPDSVNADEPPPLPPGAKCKSERYTMSQTPACASCHVQTDPIGFGLENYGPDGSWRDVEVDEPTCTVSGEGTVSGLGDFRGAGELAELLSSSPELTACMAKHLYQFATGRPPSADEAPLLEHLGERFGGAPNLQQHLVDYAASDAFRFLRVTDPN
jgi:hypothetical protein